MDSTIPKVPSWVPFIGSGLKFGINADKFLADCQQKYGDVFNIKLGPRNINFLMDPRDYQTFFKHAKVLDSLDISVDIAQKAFGYDAAYMHEYKLLEPFLEHQSKLMYGANLECLTTDMQNNFEEIIFNEYDSKEWQEGSITDFVGDLIFAAGGNALFGRETYTKDLRQAFGVLDDNFYKLIGGIPSFLLPGVNKARKFLNEDMARYRDDASVLIKTRREMAKEKDFPQDQMNMLDLSIFWAAQSNTIVVAYYTMFFILRDPVAREAVLKEVRELFDSIDDRTDYGSPKLNTKVMQGLPLLDACISETLRFTVAPITMREAQEDVDLDLKCGKQLSLKKGEFVAIYPRATHLEEDVYENPHSFIWDRFVGKSGPNQFQYKGEDLKYNLIPFGGGANICPGRYFVRNEFLITVSELLYWFDFELLDKEMPELDLTRVGAGALPVKGNKPIRFKYKFRGKAEAIDKKSDVVANKQNCEAV